MSAYWNCDPDHLIGSIKSEKTRNPKLKKILNDKIKKKINHKKKFKRKNSN
jgi:hypothetical protein